MHNLYAIFPWPLGPPSPNQKIKAVRSVRAARSLIVGRTKMAPPEDFLDLQAISRLLESDSSEGFSWVAATDELGDIQDAAAELERSGYFKGAINPSEDELSRLATGDSSPEDHFKLLAAEKPAPEPERVRVTAPGGRSVSAIPALYPPNAYKRAMVLLVQSEGNPVTAAATAYQFGSIDDVTGWQKTQGTLFEVFPWAKALVEKAGLVL